MHQNFGENPEVQLIPQQQNGNILVDSNSSGSEQLSLSAIQFNNNAEPMRSDNVPDAQLQVRMDLIIDEILDENID